MLRQYAQAANPAQQRQTLAEGGPDSLTRTRHLIEFEQRFDRMLGYPAQLRPKQHCPRLSERGHSTWYFHCFAPNLFDRSERIRCGGYPSQTARQARDNTLVTVPPAAAVTAGP